MTIADIISTISVAIAAISVTVAALAFISGINAWRREFIGKRQIELAEDVLALFYEAQDAIREIRNPFSFGGEGETRKRAEREREEESKLLDQAYIVFERYQKREKLFAELRSVKYRVMATFGSNAGEPFDEISKVLNDVFSSARLLGTYYWQRQGHVWPNEEKFQKHLEQMQKYEAVFWFMGDDDDKIGPRVQNAVERIESIAKQASLIRSSRLNSKKK